jgi:AcrR family transcriptional regulator
MPEGVYMTEKNETFTPDNKEKIKKSALKLFSEYGYGSTTVRMIAKDAGLSAGQITAHYGSKEELYQQIVSEIIQATLETYDPIENEIEELMNANRMDKKTAWSYIKKIVDIQIDYCLEPDNMSKIMMMYTMVPNSNSSENLNLNLQNTVRNKIEMLLAQLIQVYSEKKGYLRSRTISRAVNGAIVSFGEHKRLLLQEVYVGSNSPNAVNWMKGHLRDFVLNSIKAADAIEDF